MNCVVIPCYNEEHRLDAERAVSGLAVDGLRVLFVDDGSVDGTAALLEATCERHPSRASWMRLPKNAGKAEAVRLGMLRGIEDGADLVGYLDADLSTPPEEYLRIVRKLVGARASVAMGARVALLGRRIERRRARHVLGRVFATASSMVLGLAVYDTQCGAKVFRVDDTLRQALAEPFASRWAFDVELIGRLLHPGPGVAPTPIESIVEVPLNEWIHKGGSKLDPTSMVRSGLELAAIRARLRSRTHR